MVVYFRKTNKTYRENHHLFQKCASAKNLFWDKKRTALITGKRSEGGGGKTTSTEQFLSWKSPLGIPKTKLLDHKKRCMKKYLKIKSEVKYDNSIIIVRMPGEMLVGRLA